MSFGFIMFILLMFVFVLICLILLQTKTNETNEWVANTNIEKEKEKELYEIRRRVAILEKSQENEAAKEIFKGICPYTDKPCEDWNCTECEVEKAEREYIGKEDYE